MALSSLNKTTVTVEDLVRAEAFLESYLGDKIPTGNFKEGTHLHDVVVRAFAYVKALFAAEATELRSRQSLLTLANLSDSSADQATEELVANWFLTRKAGTNATGLVTVFVSTAVGDSVVVPLTTNFVFSQGISFSLDAAADIAVSRDNMVKITDSTGSLTGYKFYIPLIAADQGSAYNVTSGEFTSFDPFNIAVTSVQAEIPFTAGTDVENNEDLVERASTAITSRGFISLRSLDTTIREAVTDVQAVTVVGAGDAEMLRDKVIDLSTGVTIHVLGHTNVYNKLPLVEGLKYPGGLGGGNSIAATATTLTLSTDAVYQLPFNDINKLEVTEDGVTAEFTRWSGFSYIDTDDSTKYKVLLGDATSYVIRANDTLGATEYRVSYADPIKYATSTEAPTITVLAEAVNARTVSVEYVGTKSLPAVDTLLADRNNRLTTADLLAYGHIPVVLSIVIGYYPAADAPTTLPVTTAKASMKDFINNFPLDSVLKVSDIIRSFLSDNATYVAGVSLPIELYYRLHAPDGNVVLYKSSDKISVEDTTLLVNSSAYTDVTRIAQQVSDRTARVITFEDQITFTEVQ